jgi:hypothetical protein
MRPILRPVAGPPPCIFETEWHVGEAELDRIDGDECEVDPDEKTMLRELAGDLLAFYRAPRTPRTCSSPGPARPSSGWRPTTRG